MIAIAATHEIRLVVSVASSAKVRIIAGAHRREQHAGRRWHGTNRGWGTHDLKNLYCLTTSDVRHTWCTSHSDSLGRWPLGGYVVSLTTVALFVSRIFVSWVAPTDRIGPSARSARGGIDLLQLRGEADRRMPATRGRVSSFLWRRPYAGTYRQPMASPRVPGGEVRMPSTTRRGSPLSKVVG